MKDLFKQMPENNQGRAPEVKQALPNTARPEQEDTLIQRQALEEEREMLLRLKQRFGEGVVIGKIEKVAISFMLISALVFGGGAPEANAKKKDEQSAKIEQVKNEKIRRATIALLEQLFAISDNPKHTNNPQLQYKWKKKRARMLIEAYALNLKLGFPEGEKKISGDVSPQNIKDALDELNSAFGFFADSKFGNKDGKIDTKEISLLTKKIKGNPGFDTIKEMMVEYH